MDDKADSIPLVEFDRSAVAAQLREIARARRIEGEDVLLRTRSLAADLAESLMLQVPKGDEEHHLLKAVFFACNDIRHYIAPQPNRSPSRIPRNPLVYPKPSTRPLPTPERLEFLADALCAKPTEEEAAAKINGEVPVEVEPLTEQQQAVFDYIKCQGPKTGKEIVRACDISSESTFTRHFVPALKPYGLKNKRGAGYFIS